MSLKNILFITVGTAFFVPQAIKAQVASINLGVPDSELNEPMTRITGVAELSDGKVIIADPQERRVVMGNFETGEIVQIGRRGAGPREYENPYTIVQLAGDTLGIYDTGNRRVLLINPNGTLGETRPVPAELYAMGAMSPPKGGTVDGSLVSSVTLSGLFPDIPSMGFLVEWKPGSPVVDSIVELLVRDADGRKILNPFISRDGWDVSRDGTITIVRASDYHVDFVSSNARQIHGPPANVQATQFTEAEIDSYMSQQAGRPSAVARFEESQTPSTRRQRASLRDQWIFPEHLPVFQSGAVWTTPDGGETWVQRKLSWDAPNQIIDVFDEMGVHAKQVTLPPSTDLIGVTGRYVYLVRKDADDFLWLQRYVRP